MKKRSVSAQKAKEILRHSEVRGHALTKKQRGYFGARAGLAPVKMKKQSAAVAITTGHGKKRRGEAVYPRDLDQQD